MNDIENNRDNELWIKALKEKVNQYEPEIPQGGWDAIDKSIRRKKIRRIYYAVSAVACALVLVLTIPGLLFKPSSPSVNNTLAQAKDTKPAVTKNTDTFIEASEPIKRIIVTEQSKTAKTTKFAKPTKQIKEDNTILPDKKTISQASEDVKFAIAENKEQENKIKSKEESNFKTENLKDEWDKIWEEEDEKEFKVKKRGKITASLNFRNNGMGSKMSDNKFVNYKATSVKYDPLSPDFTTNGSQIIPLQTRWITYKPNLSTLGPDIVIFGKERYIGRAREINNICTYSHKQPISGGLTIGKELKYNLSIETGLLYTYLGSTINNTDNSGKLDQSLHYIGIPIRLNWSYVNRTRYAAYIGAGLVIDKCIWATLGTDRVKIKKFEPSVEFSAGIRLNFNNFVGLYFEPGIIYKFNSSSLSTTDEGFVIRNIYSENGIGLKLEAGIRFAF